MFVKDNNILLPAAIWACTLIRSAHGHGYMYTPRSRNWVAQVDGIEGTQSGVPRREYCHHCLNNNAGVCAYSTVWDYDDWIDSLGDPMPWISQDTFTAGDTITVQSYLSTNHWGHIEIKGCPLGRASTQDCFDAPGNTLTYVSGHLPTDPAYPERGYFTNEVDFTMTFRIPETLYGDEVLFQWRYITANSCSPPGYADYMGGANGDGASLGSAYWNPGLGSCQPPYPQDGSRSSVWPEQFWNCAEVTILSADPSATRQPTPSPITEAPVPASLTTPAPVWDATPGDGEGACCSRDYKDCVTYCGTTEESCGECSDESYKWLSNGAITGCAARWDACTPGTNNVDCCDGLSCVGDEFYSQCLVVEGPRTSSPTMAPVIVIPNIIINEILKTPLDLASGAEYFEVIRSSLVIPSYGYAVLSRIGDTATNGNLPVDYRFWGFWLKSRSDTISLWDPDDQLVDVVSYNKASFPHNKGTSMALIDPTFDNNDGSNWCKSLGTVYGTSANIGTPGAENICPTDPTPPDPTPPAPTPPAPTPPAPTPPAPRPTEGCCSQKFDTCVPWCGTSESECLSCTAHGVFWLPDGPDTSGCKNRWSDCTGDVNSCCDGLECIGNEFYRQCVHLSEISCTCTLISE